MSANRSSQDSRDSRSPSAERRVGPGMFDDRYNAEQNFKTRSGGAYQRMASRASTSRGGSERGGRCGGREDRGERGRRGEREERGREGRSRSDCEARTSSSSRAESRSTGKSDPRSSGRHPRDEALGSLHNL